jgi:hypothetical protein
VLWSGISGDLHRHDDIKLILSLSERNNEGCSNWTLQLHSFTFCPHAVVFIATNLKVHYYVVLNMNLALMNEELNVEISLLFFLLLTVRSVSFLRLELWLKIYREVSSFGI